MSFNKIIIIGHLGRDPELKSTPQGTQVCTFSVATTEKRKDQSGESKDETTWFRVTFFGRLAEVAGQYLSKGRQVYVEGRLHLREWTDKEGKARVTLEVTGSDLQLIGSRDEATHNTTNTPRAASTAAPNTATKPIGKKKPEPISDIPDSDDIPF